MLELKSTRVNSPLSIQSQSSLVVLMRLNSLNSNGSIFLSTVNESDLLNSAILGGSKFFSIRAGFNRVVVQGDPNTYG
jgi:hypothetical protein